MIAEVFITCWIWAYPQNMYVPCDQEGESIAELERGSGIGGGHG